MFENPCTPAKWLDSGDHKMALLKRSLSGSIKAITPLSGGSIQAIIKGLD